MTPKTAFQPGDRVRVQRCDGVAVVDRYIKKYGVYLLDRPISARFKDTDGHTVLVPWWTWPEEELEKVV